MVFYRSLGLCRVVATRSEEKTDLTLIVKDARGLLFGLNGDYATKEGADDD
jgi:hypothetical protein